MFPYLHGTCMNVTKKEGSNPPLEDIEEVEQADIGLELVRRRKARTI